MLLISEGKVCFELAVNEHSALQIVSVFSSKKPGVPGVY